MPILAYEITETMAAFLVLQVIGLLTLIAKSFWDSRKSEQDMRSSTAQRIQDRLDREQDRLDREQLAALTVEQLAEIKAAGGEREQRLVREIVRTREVATRGARKAVEAFREANGVNAKIAMLGQQLVEDRATPRQVQVVNSPDQPVPVNPDPKIES